jgi:serine/threonine protein kinase
MPWIPPSSDAPPDGHDDPTEVSEGAGVPAIGTRQPDEREEETQPSSDPGANTNEVTVEPTTSPSLRPGTEIGRYRVLRKLAQGGMAEVYLARAVGIEGFEKLVVLKRILPHLASNPMFIDMFLAEARLAATLDHPNIGQVFDLGLENDDYFYVMEYVRGQSLHSVLKTAHRQGRPLTAGEALTAVIGIASALAHAHEMVGVDGMPLGIVHRDISPGNVLITRDGHVKIIDFGIARAANQTRTTKEGTRKGKLSYMSPEQCLGQEIDHRSDLFSLGIILFESTTMSRLYRNENELAVVNQIAYSDAPFPSTRAADYPKDLEAVVMRALARKPEDRYTSARDMLADLEHFAFNHQLFISPTALREMMTELFYRAHSSSSHPRTTGIPTR